MARAAARSDENKYNYVTRLEWAATTRQVSPDD